MFANTDDDCPTVVPSQRFVLHLEIDEGYRPAVTALLDDINPFIFQTREDGVRMEIHLPGYPPSPGADLTRFGTDDDATTLVHGTPVGHYYQTAQELPWALDLSSGFTWPREKKPVISAYPAFADWVESAGSRNADWFLASRGVSTLVFQRGPQASTADCPTPTGPINECIPNNGNGDCDHICTHQGNGYTCSCRSGFQLNTDQRTCAPLPTYVSDPLLLKAVSFYRMNGNVIDSLGRNPMTNTGITFTSGCLRGGTCGYFNGSAFASTAIDQAIGLPMGRLPRSMNVWVKGFDTPGSLRTIFAYGTNASASHLYALSIGYGVRRAFLWANSYNLQDPTLLDPNQWTMITLTFDGTMMRFYINGVLTSSLDRSGINTSAATLSIGKNMLGTTYQQYLGYAQDLGLWDYELTASEIQHLYNNGNGIL